MVKVNVTLTCPFGPLRIMSATSFAVHRLDSSSQMTWHTHSGTEPLEQDWRSLVEQVVVSGRGREVNGSTRLLPKITCPLLCPSVF
jgi:hypothetical protein